MENLLLIAYLVLYRLTIDVHGVQLGDPDSKHQLHCLYNIGLLIYKFGCYGFIK